MKKGVVKCDTLLFFPVILAIKLKTYAFFLLRSIKPPRPSSPNVAGSGTDVKVAPVTVPSIDRNSLKANSSFMLLV